MGKNCNKKWIARSIATIKEMTNVVPKTTASKEYKKFFLGSSFEKYKLILNSGESLIKKNEALEKIKPLREFINKLLKKDVKEFDKTPEILMNKINQLGQDFNDIQKLVIGAVTPAIEGSLANFVSDGISVIRPGDKKIMLNSLELFEKLLTDSTALENPLFAIKTFRPKRISDYKEGSNVFNRDFGYSDKLNVADVYNLNGVFDSMFALSPLNVYEKSVKEIVKSVFKTVATGAYGLAQAATIVTYGPAYLIVLMAAQTHGMLAEKIIGGGRVFNNKALNSFRKRFGVSFVGDNTIELGNFERIFKETKRLMSDTFPYFYNIFEFAFRDTRVNDALDWVLKEYYPQYETLEDFTLYLEQLPEEDKINFLADLNNEVAQRYLDATGLTINSTEEAVVHSHLSYIPTAVSKFWNGYRGFMGGHGFSKARNGYRIFRDFFQNRKYTKNFEKYILEEMERGGWDAAVKFSNTVYQKNMAMYQYVGQIVLAIQYAVQIDRMNRETKNPNNSVIVNNLLNFAYPLQFLTTTQQGREIINFFEVLAKDVDNDDNITTRDLKAASISTFNKFLKNITRRAIIGKGIAGGIGRATTNDPINALSYGIGVMFQSAQNFVYYYEDELNIGGYDMYIPRANNNYLLKIFGYSNKALDFVREKSSKDKLMWLTEKDENKDKRLNNYVMYNLPFLAQFKFGTFDENDYIIDLSRKLDKDEQYSNIINGHLEYNGSQDMGEFVYNKLTELNKFDSKKQKQQRFDDGRADFSIPKKNIDPDSWFEQLKTNYQKKDGSILKYKQWKENVFVNKMLEAMEDGDRDAFIKQFNAANNSDEKTKTQMISFLETGGPGSAREIIGNITNEEFLRLMKQEGGWKDKDKMKSIKAYLGQKYGDTLYHSDALSYGEAAMFFIREKYPEFEDKIKSPYNDNGDPTKSISFVFSNGWKDNKVTNMFTMDTIVRDAVANGDTNAYKLNNVFSSLFMQNSIDTDSPYYNEYLFRSLNNTLDVIDSSDASEQEIQTLKEGLFVSLGQKLEKVNKDPKLNKLPEYNQALYRLFGSIKKGKEIHGAIREQEDMELLDKHNYKGELNIAHDKNTDSNSKSRYHTSNNLYDSILSNDRKSYDTYHKDIYSSFNSLIKRLSFPKYNNYVKRSYGKSYYNKQERDYMRDTAKNRSIYMKTMTTKSGNTGGYKKESKGGEGRFTKQFSGFAQPGGIKRTYDILEDTDREKSTFKRTMKRKVFKYDSSKTRGRVTKGGVHSIFTKKGIGGGSHPGTKRGHSRGSKNKKGSNKGSSKT